MSTMPEAKTASCRATWKSSSSGPKYSKELYPKDSIDSSRQPDFDTNLRHAVFVLDVEDLSGRCQRLLNGRVLSAKPWTN